MTTYTISKSFTMRTERTPRVLTIAESFGVGLEDKPFVLFDNLKLDVARGDVVYITGQSGSGKSQLLRELARQMREEGKRVADLEQVVLPETTLVDQLGNTTDEALQLLSRAGINDAHLTIRKSSELSDGQRYRLRLAHLFQQDADVWVADEFGAVLDRITARVIAFSAQKLARTQNRTLIVATTHTDLVDELGPSVIVQKRYQTRVMLTRPGKVPVNPCPEDK